MLNTLLKVLNIPNDQDVTVHSETSIGFTYKDTRYIINNVTRKKTAPAFKLFHVSNKAVKPTISDSVEGLLFTIL